MLKGHVFSKQIFGNPIFALFINTFLNGRNGVSNNFKNGMAVTYSGSNLNVNTGAVCIQGRFLEEDSGTQISAGTENMYCKLVIEVNLNLENTNSDFVQGAYKIVKSASGYPNLTQNNIVKNVSGIYQYELARFRTGVSGITEFKDMRTFLDFNSIYDALEKEYRAILQELENELANVKDGSAYLLKEGGTITGSLTVEDGIQSRILPEVLTNENLNDYMTTGFFYAPTQNTVKNKPSGVTWFGLICFRGSGTGAWIQLLVAEKTYIRRGEGNNWSNWSAFFTETGGTITGSLTVEDGIQSRILPEVLTNENLNDYMTTGFFYASAQNTVKNKPSGVTWFGLICFRGSGTGAWIQLLVAEKTYIRKGEGDSWSNWSAFFTETGGELKGNLRLGGYSIFIDSGSIFVESGGISTDTGDIVSGGNLGCDGDFHCAGNMKSDYTYRETTTASANVYISDNCNFRRSASSSERYKTDITEEIEERLNPEVLYNLPVKQFKYKEGYLSKEDKRYNENILGFIAEDVANIYEPATQYNSEGKPEMWNAQVMIPALLKLSQSQNERIKKLEKSLGGQDVN